MFIFEFEGRVKTCLVDPTTLETYKNVTAYEVQAPQDKLFRNAWTLTNGELDYDLTKAKNIVHEKRRVKRTEQFKPLDIEATIPSKAVQAEAARQVIRDSDALLQQDIDLCVSVDELKIIITDNGL